jgi:hypothetical protein
MSTAADFKLAIQPEKGAIRPKPIRETKADIKTVTTAKPIENKEPENPPPVEVKTHCLDLIFSSAQIIETFGCLTLLILLSATSAFAIAATGDFSCALPSQITYNETLWVYAVMNYVFFFSVFILLFFLLSLNGMTPVFRQNLIYLSRLSLIIIPLFEMTWFLLMAVVFFTTVTESCKWVFAVGICFFILTAVIILFILVLVGVTVCMLSGRLTCRCRCCFS